VRREIAKVVGERVKLKAHGVGGEGTARKPCPFDRALAFLDPLFASSTLVVEGDDVLGSPRHVRDDEADARTGSNGRQREMRETSPCIGR
jgi:hypothetical protein